MSRKSSLRVEQLEDRSVPATFGIPWHHPDHLTLSFVPDGTSIAGHVSELTAALADQPDWQRTALRAFQSWAVHANLNFAFQPDSGDAFGTPGLMQGDLRFGDIRLGAHAMSPEVLALAIPPDPALAGTWSGDVLINSAYTFDGNPYSLLPVLLHEAGHALGLDNSLNADAVMFTRYNATRTDLSAEDISRIQALYGVRAADAYEGTLGNNTRGRASAFQQPVGFKGETPLVAFGDITTTSDIDFFKFSIPHENDDANGQSATIRLQTAGVSLLTPRLTVVDSTGRVLARQVSSSITGDVLQVEVSGLQAGQTYFVRVQAATQDVFGVGSYGLSVRLNKTSSVNDEVIDRLLRGPFESVGPDAIDVFFRTNGDTLISPEEQANNTLATASRLTAVAGYSGTRWETVASISKSEDVDFYGLTIPTGAGSVLLASVWTADQTGFQPTIQVVNSSGQVLASQVLVNGNGTSTIQLRDVQPGQALFLRVTGAASGTTDKGNYLVSVSLGSQSANLRTLVQSTLSESNRVDSQRLYVAETQLFHFVLTAGREEPGASVRMTIVDNTGATVFSLLTRSGESVSGSSVLLRPGAYTIQFEVDNPGPRPLSYRLDGNNQSNPIGPVLANPTLAPKYTSPSPTPTTTFTYPGMPVPYNPSTLPGYVDPRNSSTWPAGYVPPSSSAQYPWLIVTSDPFVLIAIAL